ncbi:MAG: hypothetical protein IPJ32_13700 [Sphingobacteriaceae bacterium]|nr:hypothetical protein [Sphingobacteriaceae bacterium]
MILKFLLKINILIVAVLIGVNLNVSGQTCSEALILKNHIDRNFYNKDLDSATFFLSKFPRDKGICFQEYLIYKILLSLDKKNEDSSLIFLQELDKSLKENFSKK